MSRRQEPRTEIGRAVAGLRGAGRGWLVLSLGVGWFITLGTRFAVPAVLPAIRVEFGVSNTAAGVAVTVIWLVYGLTQLPAGILIDRIGERRLLVWSLLLGGAGLLVLVGSPTFVVLVVAAGAYGLGSGLFGPSRATVLTRTFPENDGTAFSAVLGAGNVGAAALPLAAGVLTGVVGWRLAVGVTLPLFALAAVGVWRAVPERPGERPSREAVGERLVGVWDAIARPAVFWPWAGMVLMLFGLQGLTAFLPSYLVAERGLSPALASAVFAGLFVSAAGFQLVAGGLADRFGYRPVLVGVSLVSVPPLLALPAARGLAVIVVVSLLFGVRFGAPPLTNAYIVRILPEDVRGTAWGLLRAGFFAVGATGSTVVGAMADRALFDEAFLVLAAVTFGGALLFAKVPPRAAAVEDAG